MTSPFLFESVREPEYLKPSVDAYELSAPEKPEASFQEESPISEVILERNGIHFINNHVFNPDKETEKNLDSDFRKLVDSVIKR
jgi:hypothetical protein